MLQQPIASTNSVRLERVEDPRTPLGRMRRAQLYRFADHFNIDYPRDAPAAEMCDIIRRAGYSGAEELPENPSGYEAMAMPELRAAAKELGFEQGPETTRAELVAMLNGKPIPTEIVEAPVVEEPAYDDMKMPELRKRVKDRGLKQQRDSKRADLIALLLQDDAIKRAAEFVPGETIIPTL